MGIEGERLADVNELNCNFVSMNPDISRTAFWDVNFDELDYDKNASFIMEKVFNYGLWNDQLAIMKYYGKERIRTEVVKGAYFKKKVLNFLCVIFDLQPADFTCYTRRQSHRQHWDS
jgi:hypothetical protein